MWSDLKRYRFKEVLPKTIQLATKQNQKQQWGTKQLFMAYKFKVQTNNLENCYENAKIGLA